MSADSLNNVRDKCLLRASALLDDKTAPAAATAEAVKSLVETAISIDALNLRLQEQSRSYAAGRLGSASRPQEAGN